MPWTVQGNTKQGYYVMHDGRRVHYAKTKAAALKFARARNAGAKKTAKTSAKVRAKNETAYQKRLRLYRQKRGGGA